MENKLMVNLSALNEQEQNTWAIQVCEKYKMDPLMAPISFISFQKVGTIPYINRAGSEQLIFNHKMKVSVSDPSFVNGICIVKATVTMPNGVINENIGCVNIESVKGEALSNAIMKATTKAKRRAVIGAVGLGLLDESEVEDIKYTEVKSTQQVNNNKPVTLVPATTKQEEEITAAHVMLQTTTEGLNNLYKKLTAEKQKELKKFFTIKKEEILNNKN